MIICLPEAALSELLDHWAQSMRRVYMYALWRGTPNKYGGAGCRLKEQRGTVFREVLTPQSNNNPLHHTQSASRFSRYNTIFQVYAPNMT